MKASLAILALAIASCAALRMGGQRRDRLGRVDAVVVALRSRVDLRVDSAVIARCSLVATLGAEAVDSLPADILRSVRREADATVPCDFRVAHRDVPRAIFVVSADTLTRSNPATDVVGLSGAGIVRVVTRSWTSDEERYELWPSRADDGTRYWEVGEYRVVSRGMAIH